MGHEERELGRTGAKVTRLGYGAMELAGFGGEAESAAARILGEVLDSGITLIDTAPDYAASEDLIGALQPEHESILTRAAESGAGKIVRGGVARGAPAPDYGEGKKFDFWKDFAAEKRDVFEQAGLDELRGEMPRMEFMLRFVLGHPHLDTTIVGTSNPAHLKANVEVAAKGPLPADLREEARQHIAQVLEQDSVE